MSSKIPADAKIATRAVHAGLDPDPTYGSIIPPIHQTSTFVQPSPGEYVGDFDYARSGNPTRAALEKALGQLEGGLATTFSSGLAGEHALITAVAGTGGHVVLPNDLYGGTYRLVDSVFSRWGLQYDLVDQRDLDATVATIRPETSVLWVESPTNPLLNVVDVPALIERVRSRAKEVGASLIVVVDNTFATPINQRPLEWGADAVVHSTTKYLGGHSDVVGGAVIVREKALHAAVRHVQNSIGAIPGPFDCFLLHRGLRTLHLRVAQHTKNGEAVSAFLKTVDGVTDVRWPGFGGMVSFQHPGALGITTATNIFSLAESLGGVESLIEVPAAMTHQSVAGSDAAVPADLVRLSCGVEDPDDLVADLRQAIAANAG